MDVSRWGRRRLLPGASVAATLASALAMTGSVASAKDWVAPDDVAVVGDRVPASLTGAAGSREAGRRIVLGRELGNCLICHRVPEPAERFQGELGPDLSGVGRRLDAGQLRLRLIDQSRLNPSTVMPPYYRVGGLTRVPASRAGRPVLTAEQVEDVVAYLASLTE